MNHVHIKSNNKYRQGKALIKTTLYTLLCFSQVTRTFGPK